MVNSKWNTNNIPDQSGRVIIITGANSGLGAEASKILAQKNATLILAARNLEKGQKTLSEILKKNKNAKVELLELDLASSSSIKLFAEKFQQKYNHLDVLINNAGVMACPFARTKDGFEIQMGTNHLGPFLLTGLLMPLLKKTKGSRVVSTSSIAHKMANIDFQDFNWESRKYNSGRAYGDSKLAVLYFMYELTKHLQHEENAPIITTSHPGWTLTDLQRHSRFGVFISKIFGQSPEIGVLPTLRAAFDPQAQSGDYFGPSGIFEIHGHPVKVHSSKRAQDIENAKKLWLISEKMTGITY